MMILDAGCEKGEESDAAHMRAKGCGDTGFSRFPSPRFDDSSSTRNVPAHVMLRGLRMQAEMSRSCKRISLVAEEAGEGLLSPRV